MDLRALLDDSLAKARAADVEGATPQQLHSRRSRTWVETLAHGFRTYYVDDPSVRVFSKYHPDYQLEFGLNELLYDILVCQVDTVKAGRGDKDLYYIKHVLWQVESELAKNTRQALYDFNKLVLGTADTKLFIGPHVHDEPAYLATLLPAARACTNAVFAALMPHPAVWSVEDGSIDLWQLRDAEWAPQA